MGFHRNKLLLFCLAVQQALAVPDASSDLNFYQCTYRLCDTDGIRQYHIEIMVGKKLIIPPSSMWASDRDHRHVEALAVQYGHNCRDIYVRVYNSPANDVMVPIDLLVTVRRQHRPMIMTRSCVLPVSATTEMQAAGHTPMPATITGQFDTVHTQMRADGSMSDSTPMQVTAPSPDTPFKNVQMCSGSPNLDHLVLVLTLCIAFLANLLIGNTMS